VTAEADRTTASIDEGLPTLLVVPDRSTQLILRAVTPDPDVQQYALRPVVSIEREYARQQVASPQRLRRTLARVGNVSGEGRRELRTRPLPSAAVAGERVKLVVQNRSVLGSAEARRLRRQGLIPGVLYGRDAPIAISIPERDLRRALTGSAGTHAVLDVVVDSDGGKSHSSVLKEFQRDAVRGFITHVDLQEVRLDQPISASVSVTIVGEAAGVKEGGVLTQVTNSVNVEALPLEMPDHLEFDASALAIGDSARLAELRLPDGVTLLDDPDTVIVSVSLPTRVEEPEEVLAEGEEAATEELAEGEQPEGATEAPAEPDAAAAGGEGTAEG
jgi:large subunit ribosomal protein L25